MQESPAWGADDALLDPARGGPVDGRPVAFYAAHKQDGHYGGFLCGVDYDYVYTHGAYRQMLYQMVRRAMELGMTTIHMGVTADLEKRRFETTVQRNCVYMQARSLQQRAAPGDRRRGQPGWKQGGSSSRGGGVNVADIDDHDSRKAPSQAEGRWVRWLSGSLRP